jgi:hypothetical protein
MNDKKCAIDVLYSDIHELVMQFRKDSGDAHSPVEVSTVLVSYTLHLLMAGCENDYNLAMRALHRSICVALESVKNDLES